MEEEKTNDRPGFLEEVPYPQEVVDFLAKQGLEHMSDFWITNESFTCDSELGFVELAYDIHFKPHYVINVQFDLHRNFYNFSNWRKKLVNFLRRRNVYS